MLNAKWITANHIENTECSVFEKIFNIEKDISSATLKITSRGVYVAQINNKRVGNFVMAPGWTEYETRIQVQEYDVTDMLKYGENAIDVTLASGWYMGRISLTGATTDNAPEHYKKRHEAIIAELTVSHKDGTVATVSTDETWKIGKSPITYCDIYDGEKYDANIIPSFDNFALIDENQDQSVLVEQIGEYVTEHEKFKPIKLITTPNGEKVLDFGQNLTGYVEIKVDAKKGEMIKLSFAEILDKNGNFYNENYRSAKCYYEYTCKDGFQTHKPTHTFYGFRYVRIDEYPDTEIDTFNFTAIAVYSDIRQTGKIETSDDDLNKLFHNIIWGQKCNYLDVPTDCPQRDERLGWTGDAQVFQRTASFNFDVRKFFKKWLADIKTGQSDTGAIPHIVPAIFISDHSSCGWGDVVTVSPWELYLTYGDKHFLEFMYPAMEKWIEYITNSTGDEYLWTNGHHYGDWLELSQIYDKNGVKTRDDLVASAYYAYSTSIVIKTAKILGKDSSKFDELLENIKAKFSETYEDNLCTQTEYVLALHFDLVKDKKGIAKKLFEKIISDGKMIQTGFLGTPYILHVLTDFGYNELAYELLLRKEYPSWLYPLSKGATTMWEHWDGIKPDGEIWDKKMNSYNHYAYGTVADWMYEKAAGITRSEEKPGFEEVIFAPHATDKIDSFFAEINTVNGFVKSGWYHDENGKIIYEFTAPKESKAIVNGKEFTVPKGTTTYME